MSVHPIVLHVTACLWYVYFWNNYLADNDILHDEWDPQYKKIHELGSRYLTNWNLVNIFTVFKIYL